LHALSPKNRGCPGFTVLIIYFLSFRIFEQLALALKNRVALEFFTVLKYFLLFRIFEQLALALKDRVCPEIFQARGDGRSPPTPASYVYGLVYNRALRTRGQWRAAVR